MMKNRRSDRPYVSCLLLAALLLGVHGIVRWSDRPPAAEVAVPEGVPVELAGDISFPGVVFFRSASELNSRLVHEGCPAGLGKDQAEEILSRPGRRVLVDRSPAGVRAAWGEMPAFFKITLGVPLSLNRESEEGLTAIPGIGPRIARAIVAERESRNGFRTLDELALVQGIGPSLYRRITPYLVL